MIKEELEPVLKERIRIADETQDEWDYGIDKCWEKEVEILTRDMAATINFIENECDDETFCWIGEVFYEVVAKTQSKDFFEAIKRRAAKVVDDEERRCVEVDLEHAGYELLDD